MAEAKMSTAPDTVYQKELQVALAAVRAASGVCSRVQSGQIQSMVKDDRSPVTVADFASQAVVCAYLADAFGADPVVGEEDATSLRSADPAIRKAVVEYVAEGLDRPVTDDDTYAWIDRGGADPLTLPDATRYWTVDPIDGTKGFLRGGQYAVALGLIQNGRVVLGVLGCPNLPIDITNDQPSGVLFSAVRGRGAHIHRITGTDTGTPIRVDQLNNPTQARFCESVESGHTNISMAGRIAASLGITAEPVRMDSQAKYATVARGAASIYLRLPTRADYQEKIWDHAAGAIVVEEAGGKVTDVNGKPLDFGQGRTLATNRGVVATNGLLHERVIDTLRQVAGDQ